MRCEWKVPGNQHHLQINEVTVWCVELDATWLHPEDYQDYLSDKELERASRFHLEVLRRRYILRRGLLRRFLGMYLDMPPARVQLINNANGKPNLIPDFKSDLQFNLSISEEIVLYAFTNTGRVGVDIERLKPDIEVEAIATRFFTSNEQHELLNLSADQRVEGFFNCWTRKEAFIKATGKGLSLQLDHFEVSLAPGEPARLIATFYSPGDAQGWQMQDLAVAPGYAAALVAEGGYTYLTSWCLEEGFF